MSWTSTAVVQKQQQWTVCAESSSGESAELVYESEARARYVAAVLELKPTRLPREAIIHSLRALPTAPRQPRR